MSRLAIAAAAVASMGGAQAATLTFDGPIDPAFASFFPLMGHFDQFHTDGFWVDTYNTKAGAVAGDLVGALINGADSAAMCAGLVCPSGNASNYLAALNDGLPDIGLLSGEQFRVNSFDASFIAASGDAVLATAMVLRVEGYSTSALLYTEDFYLPGPVSGGYTFATYSLSAANAAVLVNDVAFRGFACTTTTSCTRSLDKAQFGLDNLNVTTLAPIPEPAEWLLMGLGLAVLGVATRRRPAAA